jgi:uncharacterized membrane protein YjfL (UPF0719 family)
MIFILPSDNVSTDPLTVYLIEDIKATVILVLMYFMTQLSSHKLTQTIYNIHHDVGRSTIFVTHRISK